MKYLHLCLDHNFIEKSYDMFDKYYPGKNIYLINKNPDDFKIIKDKSRFIGIPYQRKENFDRVWEICQSEEIYTLVLHGISLSQRKIVEYLLSKRDFKIYWIFWGFELYQTLAFKHGYKLIDERFSLFKPHTYLFPSKITYIMRKLLNKAYIPESLEFLLPHIDYFCFWNKFDYELLCKYYKTSIKFKYFNYGGIYNKETQLNFLYPLKNKEGNDPVIMINHQASQTGNHMTIMKRIHEIDSLNRFTKLLPISYGSIRLRAQIKDVGSKLFNEKFYPVENYMNVDEYYKLLSNVDVAVFGQHRQEAAGNIIQLLRNGVKIFLRNDNNLLNYYKSKGYLVFSYEDDLNSYEDLQPLTLEEKEHNRNCYIQSIPYCDDFMPNFFE